MLSRFLALLTDWILGYAAFLYCLRFSNFDNFYQSFEELFLPHGWIWTPLVVALFPAMILRFTSTLLLGVSIGQWCCGIRGQASWWWNRAGGAGRVFGELLSVIIFPILLVNLVSLFGQRSLGERLTFTRLKDEKHWISGLFKGVAVPLLLTLSFCAPFFLDSLPVKLSSFSFRPNIFYERGKPSPQKKRVRSNYFSFENGESFQRKGFLILPNFEVIRENGVKKINPYIDIFDLKSNIAGELKLVKKFNFNSLVKTAKIGNPLFRYYYPDLKDLANPLSLEQKDQLEMLLGDSLGVNYSSLENHIMTRGPFLNGYLGLKRGLIKKFEKGAHFEASISKLGDHNFLILQDRRMRQDRETIAQNFIPFEAAGLASLPVLQFSWDSSQETEAVAKEFQKGLFSKTKWLFGKKSASSLPKDQKDMTPFHIVDHLIQSETKKSERVLLEKFFHEYYQAIATKVMIDSDHYGGEKLKDKIGSILRRSLAVIDSINKVQVNFFSRSFVTHISALERAFRLNNRDYFTSKVISKR